LLPYILMGGDTALRGTLVATAICLFGVGAAISLFTGKQAWYGGLRMLAIGAVAGAATWSIGHLLGVALG